MKIIKTLCLVSVFLPVVLFFYTKSHAAGKIRTPAKKALITGVLGQDGSYLAEFLLNKGYHVIGTTHQITNTYTDLINNLMQIASSQETTFTLMPIDITHTEKIYSLIEEIEPDEIYNLAAQSHVGKSFENPQLTVQVNTIGAINILEGIRRAGLINKTKFYQASSSELYCKNTHLPVNENTPYGPCSPYAVSKLGAHWSTINYREAYGMFACNGILFNHESERRPADFVIQKIVKAVASIKLGLQDVLHLGNLDVKKDWGCAQDYIEAMWLMLQQEKPDDYIIATGTAHSLRELVTLAFKEVSIDIEWQGSGLNEIGIDKKTGKKLVGIDRRYFRPVDSRYTVGDSTKAQKILNWAPKTSFKELIQLMLTAEYKKLSKKTPAKIY